MTPYSAPLEDMRFVLNHVVGLNEITKLPGFEGIDTNLTDQILEEAGKFSSNILAPLNQLGDTKGAQIENGIVRAIEGLGTPTTNGRKQDGIRVHLMPSMEDKDFHGR